VFQSFNLWQHMTVLQNVIEAPVHVFPKNGERENLAKGHRKLRVGDRSEDSTGDPAPKKTRAAPGRYLPTRRAVQEGESSARASPTR